MSTEPEARWRAPYPYGYAAAMQSMGTVAAPLLAGVSAALVALVIQNARVIEWPNVALLALVAATFGFLGTVQCTFRARQFAVTPSEMEVWHPNPDKPATREMLRREQRYYYSEHERWTDWASYAYDFGLLFFLLGLVAITAPAGGLASASNGRLAVLALGAFAVAAEFVWIARKSTHRPAGPRYWPPPPGPEWEG